MLRTGMHCLHAKVVVARHFPFAPPCCGLTAPIVTAGIDGCRCSRCRDTVPQLPRRCAANKCMGSKTASPTQAAFTCRERLDRLRRYIIIYLPNSHHGDCDADSVEACSHQELPACLFAFESDCFEAVFGHSLLSPSCSTSRLLIMPLLPVTLTTVAATKTSVRSGTVVLEAHRIPSMARLCCRCATDSPPTKNNRVTRFLLYGSIYTHLLLE